jgi:hypothetical protein
MGEHDKKSSTFEEVNPFPEQAGGNASTDDDSDVIYWDPDDKKPARVTYEDVRPVSASADISKPIVDDTSSLKKTGEKISVRPRSGGSEFEDMARDIDSLELPSGGEKLSGDTDDFLSVLDDNRLNMIDEVVDRSVAEYGDIEILASADYTDNHSEVSLIDEERLVESKPLWSDDDDFWVNDAEGFDVPPHEIIALLKAGGSSSVEPASLPEAAVLPAEPSVPAVPEVPFPDRPYIIQADSDEVRIDVAALIDPVTVEEMQVDEIPAAPKKTEKEPRIIGEIDIPFVEIDPDDLKDLKKAENARSVPGARVDGQPGEFNPPAGAGHRLTAGAEKSEKRIEPIVRSRLPENFSITHIDLSEAEKIAKEDIFILSEEDLIEELEQIDLVPVMEMHPESVSAASEETVSRSLKGEFTWLTPDESAITDGIKQRIESEITASPALIVEEDIRDIRSKLSEYSDSAESEDSLLDITDRVVLMEDQDDVERFMAGIPEEKREEMRKLLTYLDGLFEKLPEDVVRKFADSEYFDLYVKIMNDLGK